MWGSVTFLGRGSCGRRGTVPAVKRLRPIYRRSSKLAVCLLLGAMTLTGCASKIERALRHQRGTEVWNTSSDAFKEIMRRYVHGDNHTYTDADLDEQFENFVTLDAKDVKAFIRSQSCLPPTGSGPARYYTVNAAHQRHDKFYQESPAKPLTGEGRGKTLKATFSANMLLERHEISAATAFPERARYPYKKGSEKRNKNPFTSWEALATIMSDEQSFLYEESVSERASVSEGASVAEEADAPNAPPFYFRNSEQARAVLEASKGFDWSTASGQLYIAPQLSDDKDSVFSPALFMIILLRESNEEPFSMYVTVSANASGHPEISYAGLIRDNTRGQEEQRDPAGQAEPQGQAEQEEPFLSDTRFKFTPLSNTTNFLDYELVLTGEDPTSFELWMTIAFPGHPDRPYLTVRSVVSPAVSETVIKSYTGVKSAKLIMMLRKGAMMRDLVAAYYPDASELDLWKDVGAIKNDSKFSDRLEAAGLTVGRDLLESRLWLEKPTVVDGDDRQAPSIEALPGMDLRCETSP